MTASLNSVALPTASAIVGRAQLDRAIGIAATVVEKRNTYPILSNLRLQGDGSNLFVTGTDLDIELVVAIPAPADAAFDVTIPAHVLAAIMKGAPAADYVGFTRNSYDDDVTADFESASYKLATMDAATWPEFHGPGWRAAGAAANDNFDGVYRFTMSGKDFYDLFDAVKFAISSEETRYYLNGVFFHVVGDTMRAVTTDGHRMARQEYPAPMGAEGMPGVIVPKKTVLLLEKLMRGKKCPGTVKVEVEGPGESQLPSGGSLHHPGRVRFQFDDVTLTSKVIDGTFPDYERVTPKHNDKLATFTIADMVKKIGAVSAIASSAGGKAVKIQLFDSSCKVSVSNPDAGTAEAILPVSRNSDADDFEIGFNARYLLDILGELAGGGDTATMHLNDIGSPALISGVKDGFLTVLMPMRV